MIIHEFDLDMVPNGQQVSIWLNQYDEDFLLKANLFARTGEFTIQEGTTAAIRGTKPDGNGYSADASINGSVVTVVGDQQITVASGKAVFELTLYKDGKELNTANFTINIERAALDKDTPHSRSQTRELVDIEDNADELITAATAASGAADRAEAAATDARASADLSQEIYDTFAEIDGGDFTDYE